MAKRPKQPRRRRDFLKNLQVFQRRIFKTSWDEDPWLRLALPGAGRRGDKQKPAVSRLRAQPVARASQVCVASAHAMHTHPASGEAHAPETLFFGHSWISVFKPTNVQAGPPCGSRGPPAFPTHPLHIHPRPDRPARVKRAFVASP